MNVLSRLFLAFAPLLLSVLFAWLVMESYLNLGGGEKDVFLAIPLLFWSLVYLCCFLVLWWRRSAAGRSIVWSAALATGVVAITWIVLFGVFWLK
jgi:hypothetical protein